MQHVSQDRQTINGTRAKGLDRCRRRIDLRWLRKRVGSRVRLTNFNLPGEQIFSSRFSQVLRPTNNGSNFVSTKATGKISERVTLIFNDRCRPYHSRSILQAATGTLRGRCITSSLIFLTGDTVAQQAVEKKGWNNHDVQRTSCMVVYGGMSECNRSLN